jgi:hypothetical protein
MPDLAVSVPGPEDLATAADLGRAAPADLGVPTVRATVRPVDGNVVTAIVDVTAVGASEIVISQGPTASYGEDTPRLPLPPGGVLSVPVLGLTPDAVNHLRVTAYSATGLSADTGDLTFTAGALPANLPTVQVTYNHGGVTGFLLVSVLLQGIPDCWALIVDRTGRLYWYRDMKPSTARGTDFQMQPNRNLTVYQNSTLDFEELDLASNVLRRWRAPTSPNGADGHEIQLLENHNALLFGWTSRIGDVSAYRDGGATDALIYTNTLEEVTPDGGSVFRWQSDPEITLDESSDWLAFQGGLDTVHPNAIAVSADGNLLLSLRHIDTVVKLDRSTGKILWRLGGKKSDFTFVDDPMGGPSHQHDVRELPNGDITLVDNGNFHVPQVTRVVQYRLDYTKKTARLVWQYHHSPELFSFFTGSARRLPNGNTVIGWGAPGVITEVDPFANVVWEAKVPNRMLYRALPVERLYP